MSHTEGVRSKEVLSHPLRSCVPGLLANFPHALIDERDGRLGGRGEKDAAIGRRGGQERLREQIGWAEEKEEGGGGGHMEEFEEVF